MQKLTELKGETDSSTIIVGDFNTLLSIMDTATRQKIRKKIEDFTTQYNKLALTYTASTQEQNTHSSPVHMEYFPGQTIGQAKG